MKYDTTSIVFLFGSALLFIWLILFLIGLNKNRKFRPERTSIKVFGSEFELSSEDVLLLSALLLLAPRLYYDSLIPRDKLVVPAAGYDLCKLQPFSRPASMAGGVDDETKAVLQSLIRLPNDQTDELTKWGLQIGKILKADKEVLQALQSAIIRSNFNSDTIEIYCTGIKKSESDRSVEDNRAICMIDSAKGFKTDECWNVGSVPSQ